MGCAHTPTADLPVYTPPTLTIPVKPTLACAALTSRSTPMQVQKAEVSDLYALMDYCTEEHNLLVTENAMLQ